MSGGLQQLWARLPPGFFRTALVRLSLLLVFAGSLALAWWSVSRLKPLEKLLQKQSEKLAHLEDEVMKMELKWNQQEADQMTNRFRQSQEELFLSQDEVLLWQVDLKRRADQFAMTVNSGITKTQECPLPGKRFSIYSATVDMRPNAPGIRTNSPYLRLLNFAHDVTSQKRRVDLTELAAGGSSNSVNEAKLALQLWSLENVQ